MTIPTTYHEADALLRTARSEEAGKPVANNTRLFRRGENIALRLHNTDIVIYHPDGSQTLHTDGWTTVTTKARMNEALDEFAIYSRKGRWFIARIGLWDMAVPFTEGMTVRADLPLRLSEAEEQRIADEDERNRSTRKAIKRYVDAITPERIVEAFENPSGDCWGCMMVAEDGSYPMGDDCVALHVEEGYFHAHLMLRAIKAKGYRDPQFIMSMIYGRAQRGDVDRLFCKQVLSGFLRKHLTVGTVAVK